MNSPFLNAAGWNAEVTKMIKATGAPIGDDDAKVIIDYLAKNCGTSAVRSASRLTLGYRSQPTTRRRKNPVNKKATVPTPHSGGRSALY